MLRKKKGEIDMRFVKQSANLTPIVDNVFSIVSLAKKDKQQNGNENVIDATIGSLYGEDETLVAGSFTVFKNIEFVKVA